MKHQHQSELQEELRGKLQRNHHCECDIAWMPIGDGLLLGHPQLRLISGTINFRALHKGDELRLRIQHPEQFVIPTDMNSEPYRLASNADGEAELLVQVDHMEFYHNGFVGMVCYGMPVTMPDIWLQARIIAKATHPYGASLSLLQTRAFPSGTGQDAFFEQAMDAIL